jgi:hypothetical protein
MKSGLSRLQRISSFSRGSGNCDSALGERGRDSTPPYPRHELYGVGSPLGDLSMLVKDPEKDGFEGDRRGGFRRDAQTNVNAVKKKRQLFPGQSPVFPSFFTLPFSQNNEVFSLAHSFRPLASSSGINAAPEC